MARPPNLTMHASSEVVTAGKIFSAYAGTRRRPDGQDADLNGAPFSNIQPIREKQRCEGKKDGEKVSESVSDIFYCILLYKILFPA